MQERILELIIFLMEEINSDSGPNFEMDHITHELRLKGFSDYEIGIALSWIFDHSDDKSFKEESIDNDAFRILNSVEKYQLPPEIYGYLISLKQLKLINNTDLENIIQHLFQIERSSLDLDLTKHIVANMLIQLESFEGKFQNKLIFSGNNTVH